MNGISHTFRNGDLEVFIDGFSCALNNPGKNRAARMFHQIVRIIFDIRLALDLGLKGDDDESSPSAVIIGAHLGEMIGIKDKGMRRSKFEGILVFLFAGDKVGGTKLLDDGCIQPHAFLKLGSYDKPFSLQLCYFRLHISSAADR